MQQFLLFIHCLFFFFLEAETQVRGAINNEKAYNEMDVVISKHSPWGQLGFLSFPHSPRAIHQLTWYLHLQNISEADPFLSSPPRPSNHPAGLLPSLPSHLDLSVSQAGLMPVSLVINQILSLLWAKSCSGSPGQRESQGHYKDL